MNVKTVGVIVIVADVWLTTCVRAWRLLWVDLLGERTVGLPLVASLLTHFEVLWQLTSWISASLLSLRDHSPNRTVHIHSHNHCIQNDELACIDP